MSDEELRKAISNRLKEERERLDMNQTALGDVGGVKKLSQINYERGSSMPSADYLAKVAAVGVDVLYVITGKRLAAGNTVSWMMS
ncbi:MAG: hypothetical protein BWK73_09195 [Thiothrix lacustris]|uniref:HTH cro/C1-type domain-containing protein n=1 Tax=Thiothrix lacustris TaxID=525917 RepID=A0A1Y1QV11_9GAMM|nr:MAG: hypothetical protein BWK73_09195 [Thiothrix lacustris]